jgi:hypothetical protein
MIKILLYLFLVASLHALLEIMIEAKEGWARKLPCWRLNVFVTKFIIGKELTGYHCYLMLLFLTLFHSPLLFMSWTPKIEYLIMGTFMYYWIAEDFLWFVYNHKHYGIKAFRKGKIEWHQRWFVGIPVSYWISIVIGGICLYLGGRT